MINILLSIIIVLLFARIVLQVRQGKRAVEKGYASASEVENCMTIVADHYVASTISDYAKRGWELVQVIDRDGGSGNSRHQLFFTRKKIKTYYENEQ